MLHKCQLILATGGTVAQDLTMQWSTMDGFMQELSLLVIDEGQQYGTDREIAVISLLRQQPLVLWTGDSEQTPGGIDRAARNAKRSRQLLLAKRHGLRSNRNYYTPATLADAMTRLLDGFFFFRPTPPRLSPGRYTSFNLPEIELICMKSHKRELVWTCT